MTIAFIQAQCPQCGETLIIHQYEVSCPGCRFQANRGTGKAVEGGLTAKEYRSLLLLASHAGKVMLVYALLKKIPATRTSEIMEHPDFVRGEYQKLLHFYDALALKCEALLAPEEIPSLAEILEL